MLLFIICEASQKNSTIFRPFLAIFTLFHLINWPYLQKPQLGNLGKTRFWLLLVNNELCSIPLSFARSEIKEIAVDRCENVSGAECSIVPSPPINSAPSPLCRLSVSESSEWVCTKTIFANGSVVRGCEKTYTGKSVRYRINKQRLVVVVSGDLVVVWTRLQTREWTQPLASLLVVVVHQDYWRLRICLLSIIYNWLQDGNSICLYLQNML